MWGSACGALAVYKTLPFIKEMSLSYGIMRKAWMRYPIPAVIFFATYHVATALPQRVGRRITTDPTVNHNTYTGADDVVGRFRLFENNPINSEDGKMNAYISTYSDEAMTEPEIMEKLTGD